MVNKQKKNNSPKPAPVKVQVVQVPMPQQRRRPRGRGRGNRNANRKDMAPVALGRVVTTPQSKVVTITNSDYIESSLFTKVSKSGDILAEVQLAPTKWIGTHAESIAALYEKYRFTKLEMIISARVPTSIAGGYLAGMDRDADRSISGDTRKFVRTLEGSVSAPYWTTTILRAKPDNAWRYTSDEGTERRWSSLGNLYLVVDVPPTNAEGDMVMSIEVKYTMQVCAPIVSQKGDTNPRTWYFPRTTYSFNNDVAADAEKGISLKLADGVPKDFWEASKYDRIYKTHPEVNIKSLLVKGYYGAGDDEVNAMYCRTHKTSSNNYGLIFFPSEAAAREAGSNPSQDHLKQVRFRRGATLDADTVVASLDLEAFTMVELNA